MVRERDGRMRGVKEMHDRERGEPDKRSEGERWTGKGRGKVRDGGGRMSWRKC